MAKTTTTTTTMRVSFTDKLIIVDFIAKCLQVLGTHEADPGLGTHSVICMRTIVKCLY